MALPQLVTHWWGKDRTAELAERIAGRSRQQVWQRTHARIGVLPTAEVRGYIRARAAYVIQEETERLIEQEGPRVARLRDRLVETASELLIESLLASSHFARQSRTRRRAA